MTKKISKIYTKCEKCGRENIIVFDYQDKKLCNVCFEEIDREEVKPLSDAKTIHFATKISKMGKYRRIVEIPKTQKPLVKDGIMYDVILVPIGGGGE